MASSMFSGLTIDFQPIIKGVTDMLPIALPAMIALIGFNRGIGFLKGALKTK